MRHSILIAISAIALAGAASVAARAAEPDGLRSASPYLGLVQPVARVCREVCRDNFCRTRCFEEHDHDEVVRERIYHDYDHDRDRDRDRDHRGGVELNVPGVRIQAH